MKGALRPRDCGAGTERRAWADFVVGEIRERRRVLPARTSGLLFECRELAVLALLRLELRLSHGRRRRGDPTRRGERDSSQTDAARQRFFEAEREQADAVDA